MKKFSIILIPLIVITVLISSCNNNSNNISSLDQETEKHSHSFGKWETIREATCSNEGMITRICECGESENDIIPTIDHSISYTITTPPTMISTGYVTYECNMCNFKSGKSVIPSLDKTVSYTEIKTLAEEMANNRLFELIDIYKTFQTSSGNYNATEDQMKEAISKWHLSDKYKSSVSLSPEKVNYLHLIDDYMRALEYFNSELEADFDIAQTKFNESPYIENGFDEITSFMYFEGFVKVTYGELDGIADADKSVILSIIRDYPGSIDTKEEAIEYVYNALSETNFHIILSAWNTGLELQNYYITDAINMLTEDIIMTGDKYVITEGNGYIIYNYVIDIDDYRLKIEIEFNDAT